MILYTVYLLMWLQYALEELWTKDLRSHLPMACYPSQHNDELGQAHRIKANCLDSHPLLLADPAAEAVMVDLILHGDGGFWLDHVIKPLFWVLAHEASAPTYLIFFAPLLLHGL